MPSPAKIDKIAANTNAYDNAMPPNNPARIAPSAAKPSPTDEIKPRAVDSRCPIFSRAIAMMTGRTASIRSPAMIRSGNMIKLFGTNVINHANIPPPISPHSAKVLRPILSERCPINGAVTAPPSKNNATPIPVKLEEKPLDSWKYKGAILIKATNDILWRMITNKIASTFGFTIDLKNVGVFTPDPTFSGGAITIGANLIKTKPKIIVGSVLI